MITSLYRCTELFEFQLNKAFDQVQQYLFHFIMTVGSINISSYFVNNITSIRLLLVAVILSRCMSYRFIESSINVTSSNSQKIKIIKFGIDVNSAMSLTLAYEIIEPWDHILVMQNTK